MKVIIISSLIAACTFLAPSTSAHSNHAPNFVAKDNTDTSRLCAAIAANNLNIIERRLRDARLTKQNAKRVLKCNGLPLSEFAHKHNANKAIASLNLKPTTTRLAQNKL